MEWSKDLRVSILYVRFDFDFDKTWAISMIGKSDSTVPVPVFDCSEALPSRRLRACVGNDNPTAIDDMIVWVHALRLGIGPFMMEQDQAFVFAAVNDNNCTRDNSTRIMINERKINL
jgi:hypothetical protein